MQTFTGVGGAPLAGGFVYTYVPGTTTPKTTYVDQGLTVPNTNPIVLNANGQATIWAAGGGSYRELVTDASGVTVWDQITFVPTNSTLSGPVTGSPTTTRNSLAIWDNNTGTLLRNPTATVTGTFSATDTFLQQLVITSDSANAGGNNVWGLAINETCCTNAAQGQRFLLGARLDITGASAPGDPRPNYTSVFGNTRVRDNIAAPNASGGVWSGNFNSELGINATGWAELQGAEFDVTAKTGATVIRKVGISIVQGPTDVVHGTSTDAAIGLYNAPGGTAPWNNILDLDSNTRPVISTTGAIIRSRGTVTFADLARLDAGTTITNGLNFNSATVTNAVLLGPGANSVISGLGDGFFNRITDGIGNLGAAFPPTRSGWALTTNFAGGEVDLWNTNEAGNGFFFRQKTGASAGNIYGEFVEAGALATTGLVVRVNNSGGGLSSQGVSLGAADSGGAGFRVMRVAN